MASLHISHERSRVLRRLASGAESDERRLTAEVADLVCRRSLLPPAEAAFIDDVRAIKALPALIRADAPETPQEVLGRYRDDPPQLTPADLSQLRSLARRLLEAHSSGDRSSPDYPRPRHFEQHSIALQYAEAVARQEELLQGLNEVDFSNAPLHASLTGTDRERVDAFLLYLNLRGRFETLDSLVDQWERSIRWLEDAADTYQPEELVDRLISRDSLEQALSLLSPTPRESLESRIRSLDRRFEAATQGVSGSVRPVYPWQPQRWWWSRIPRLPGEAFMARLKAVAPEVHALEEADDQA